MTNPRAGPRGFSRTTEAAITPVCLQHTFALRFFPSQFTGPADRFGALACFFLRRFLEMLLKLHFPKHTLTLKFFLQRAQRLIDVIVANTNLHVVVTTFLS